MGNITLAIPDEVHKKMKQMPDIRWSEVARKAIMERVYTMQEIERIAQKSKLTKKDVEEFSKMITQKATKSFLSGK